MKEAIKDVAITTFHKKGILRKEYIEKIESWLSRPEIIIIKGIRRCGKSTILQQIAQRTNKKCIYINFDDYRFLQHLDISLLDEVLKEFKDYDYYFFDEIQKIKGFESWLRTYYDIQSHKKFIISGSNISLFAPSLATVLTGRNITFEIFPFSYSEIRSNKLATFEEYLNYGGFPEIVLEKDIEKKKQLALQYFNDILLRDIFEKYSVVATQQFKALAQYILSNPGLKVSSNKLAKELGINSRSAENYLSYLIDAYLIFEVPFFSYSAKTKYISGRASKYYVLDNGLTTALSSRISEGHLFEALVAQKLRKNTNEQIYYWAGKNEVDFISDGKAFNVVSSEKIPPREYLGLAELKEQKKHLKDFILITRNKKEFNEVQHLPIEEFLESK
ncbi:MAG: ATP-binding protein [Nanoarchaeota archaeon]